MEIVARGRCKLDASFPLLSFPASHMFALVRLGRRRRIVRGNRAFDGNASGKDLPRLHGGYTLNLAEPTSDSRRSRSSCGHCCEDLRGAPLAMTGYCASRPKRQPQPQSKSSRLPCCLCRMLLRALFAGRFGLPVADASDTAIAGRDIPSHRRQCVGGDSTPLS